MGLRRDLIRRRSDLRRGLDSTKRRRSGWAAVQAGDRAARTTRSARPLAWIKEEQIQEDVIDEALEPEWIGNDLCRWRRAEFLIGASGEKLEDRRSRGSRFLRWIARNPIPPTARGKPTVVRSHYTKDFGWKQNSKTVAGRTAPKHRANPAKFLPPEYGRSWTSLPPSRLSSY